MLRCHLLVELRIADSTVLLIDDVPLLDLEHRYPLRCPSASLAPAVRRALSRQHESQLSRFGHGRSPTREGHRLLRSAARCGPTGNPGALLHSHDLVERNTRNELNPHFRSSPGSDLAPVLGLRYRNQHPDIDQCASGSGVERQFQDCAASRTPQLRSNDDEPLARVEREAHKTIAVSSGISPV